MIDMTEISTIAALVTIRFESDLALTSDYIANYKDYFHKKAVVKWFDGANLGTRVDRTTLSIQIRSSVTEETFLLR